jgi:nucleotide-binding universal stress UspA family protein
MGFACDYRNIEATTPVSFFKKVMSDFRADLFVLNINQPGHHVSEETIKEGEILHELLKDVKVLYNTIEAGDVIDGINWFIEKEKLDWIVVIPKKHPLLQKMFSRSHTKDLLHHTHVPVLCIHE